MTAKIDFNALAQDIKLWAKELGFQQAGIADTDLSQAEGRLQAWLAKQFHGEMHYMSRYGTKRSRPSDLLPGTIRIISVRMNYLPPTKDRCKILTDPTKGVVSCYALGRDYHKLIRKRLQKLANQINTVVHDFSYRAFADSAPVMEKAIAEKAGLGWIGKNTNIINHQAGSWFFIGTLYTNLPLPIDIKSTPHCGSCTACLDICPTQAIVAPYQLDARRCISYLTIELKEAIPVALRPLIGNRIYGCDDCQLVCPWNKFAKITDEQAFHPRHDLSCSDLISLFAWSEADFMQKTEGSAIRRIGYECWLRNIAVALGNAPSHPDIIIALKARSAHTSQLVREHVLWALEQQAEVV